MTTVVEDSMLFNSTEEHVYSPNLQGWIVCMTAALFFFYDFIQMNLFSVINVPLMSYFHLNAQQLGGLSSYFFMANALFLIPVGTILDRISTKKTILYTLLLGILSIWFFSYVQSLGWAKFFRFTSGITSAFCFLACVRLGSRWFPPRRFALVMGFVVTMAMIGGMVAQTPAAVLVKHFGWRSTLRIDALLGFLVWVMCWLLIKDYPRKPKVKSAQSRGKVSAASYCRSTWHAVFRYQVWLGALYTCLMNLPVCVLGGIWGTLYLHYTQSLNMVQSSELISFIFFGTIIGSPLCGWISDRIGRRRLPMIAGVILSVLSFMPLLLHVHYGFFTLAMLFFAVGLFTSTQILSYPFVSEISPLAVTATAVSVVSFVTIGSLSFFQPLFGALVDRHAQLGMHQLGHYTAGDYYYAMWLYPVCFVVALGVSLLIKESYCRRAAEK